MKRRSISPIYKVAYLELYEGIMNGLIKPGNLLPSEKVLMDQYAISRTSARKALNKLVEEGLIYRVPGKGSFVKNTIRAKIHLFGSFNDILDIARSTKFKVIKFEYTQLERGSDIAIILGQKKDLQVLRIDRIRFINKNPFLYSINYLPEELGQYLTKEEVETNSISDLLPKKCRVDIDYAIQRFKASVANQSLAQYLCTEMGFPLLNIERVTYSSSGQPVNFFIGFFRSDIYVFEAKFNFKSKPKKSPS